MPPTVARAFESGVTRLSSDTVTLWQVTRTAQLPRTRNTLPSGHAGHGRQASSGKNSGHTTQRARGPGEIFKLSLFNLNSTRKVED